MDMYLLGSPWDFSSKVVVENKWSARVQSDAAGVMEERSEVPEISKWCCQNIEVCRKEGGRKKKILKIDFPSSFKIRFS